MTINSNELERLCGPQERQVYQALLTHEYMSTKKVVEKLRGKIAKTGVPSYLSKLRAKGLIRSEKRGNTALHIALKERLLVPQGKLRYTKANGANQPKEGDPQLLINQGIQICRNLEEVLVKLAKQMEENEAAKRQLQALIKEW